ncbi:alpha-taxilin-like [Stigmatopora argus]
METSTLRPEETGADERMDEFSRRLSDIVAGEAPGETDEPDDFAVDVQSELCRVAEGLSALSSPEEKLQHLMRDHAELVSRERGQRRLIRDLRDNVCGLRAKRSQLENLCKEVQDHYAVLREEALRRCRRDEEKRSEMAARFQTSLTEIQEQIEHHSARNQRLCDDNAKLSDKLHSLLEQCQRREESSEKMERHHDLQRQLTSAKLEQANALLAEARQKHQREKEYLLAEAVDKTRKCVAMKEEELSTKKKLALYSKKFDEFQTTLAKSNEIYARFKNEMENMSQKMKNLEKESDVWKLRFENCNKALSDLLEERSEKGKEYEVFVVTIHKLEKLCRALQDERKILYAKIKDVRRADAGATDAPPEAPDGPDGPDGPHSEDDAVTEEMRHLTAEQVKLQELADFLVASRVGEREAEPSVDPEEDVAPAAFRSFGETERPSAVEAPSKVKLEAESQFQPGAEAEPVVLAEPVVPAESVAEEGVVAAVPAESNFQPAEVEKKMAVDLEGEVQQEAGPGRDGQAEAGLDPQEGAQAPPTGRADSGSSTDGLRLAAGAESAPAPPPGTRKKESKKSKKKRSASGRNP